MKRGQATERRRVRRPARRAHSPTAQGSRSTSRCATSTKYSVAVAERGGQVLGDRDRAVAPAGAADRHHQVRLALGDVLREQELQQRDHVRVELLQAAVAADVVDDPLVEAGQRAQVGVVVRVGEEADVEREVGVARRAVLVAEGRERDRQPAGRGGLEQLVGDLAAQRGGAQARRVDHDVRALRAPARAAPARRGCRRSRCRAARAGGAGASPCSG